ncbi:MAG: fumarylacetoacetate hydrolase family protein [Candidatus Sumerlaeia bacterium]
MKIVRVRTHAGEVCHGVMEENGSVRRIEGNILGKWSVGPDAVAAESIERMLAPVDPPNIVAIGLNYVGHARETEMKLPTAPVVFLKATTSLAGPGDPILLPPQAPNEVDFEGELALVIGRKARGISRDEAMDYVLGWTAANDVSARDCQMRLDVQWTRAKSFDTFCPIGPCIQTEGDPDNLAIRTRLEGELMQEACTKEMLFSCRTLVSYLSHQFTLLPGTIILTGTPEGVGHMRTPPRFMREGETVEVEIEGVGTLRNPVRKGLPNASKIG